jgi:hypothetical protein
MEVSGGYFANELTQKSPWTQVITSLDMTEKQKRTAIAILQHIVENGEQPYKSDCKCGDGREAQQALSYRSPIRYGHNESILGPLMRNARLSDRGIRVQPKLTSYHGKVTQTSEGWAFWTSLG